MFSRRTLDKIREKERLLFDGESVDETILPPENILYTLKFDEQTGRVYLEYPQN